MFQSFTVVTIQSSYHCAIPLAQKEPIRGIYHLLYYYLNLKAATSFRFTVRIIMLKFANRQYTVCLNHPVVCFWGHFVLVTWSQGAGERTNWEFPPLHYSRVFCGASLADMISVTLPEGATSYSTACCKGWLKWSNFRELHSKCSVFGGHSFRPSASRKMCFEEHRGPIYRSHDWKWGEYFSLKTGSAEEWERLCYLIAGWNSRDRNAGCPFPIAGNDSWGKRWLHLQQWECFIASWRESGVMC